MERYTLHDAQAHLPELVQEALQGKTIWITDNDQQIVQLVPIARAKKPRQAGSAKGLIQMSPDFDAPT
jgi:antitoxin (DNA-binding transcriptional repressor) of toxin-antitoxin stability system